MMLRILRLHLECFIYSIRFLAFIERLNATYIMGQGVHYIKFELKTALKAGYKNIIGQL